MVICPLCKNSVGHNCSICGKCGHCHTAEEHAACKRAYFRGWARRKNNIPKEKWRVREAVK